MRLRHSFAASFTLLSLALFSGATVQAAVADNALAYPAPIDSTQAILVTGTAPTVNPVAGQVKIGGGDIRAGGNIIGKNATLTGATVNGAVTMSGGTAPAAPATPTPTKINFGNGVIRAGSSVVVGTDPGGSEVLRVGGNMRLLGGSLFGGTSTSQLFLQTGNSISSAQGASVLLYGTSEATRAGQAWITTGNVPSAKVVLYHSSSGKSAEFGSNGMAVGAMVVGTDPIPNNGELLRVGGNIRSNGRNSLFGLAPMTIGSEAGHYPDIGYNLTRDETNTQRYSVNDSAAKMRIGYNAFPLQFYYAPAGSANTNITWSEALRVTAAGALVVNPSNDPGGSELLRVGGSASINGRLIAGDRGATNGSVMLTDNYSGPEHLTTFGTSYSHGGPVIGYGIIPSTVAPDAFSSSASVPGLSRAALSVTGNSAKFWFGSAQTVAIGGAVSISKVAEITNAGDIICNGGINASGNVVIGSFAVTPTSKLAVNGTISAKEIKVTTTGADYVFADTYRLRPLMEVEQFIKVNRHLPEIPSAKVMQQDGMGVSEIVTKQLAKIEELTLYAIAQKKETEVARAEVEATRTELNDLKSRMERLEKALANR